MTLEPLEETYRRHHAGSRARSLLAPFDDVEIGWAAGRFTRLHPRLFDNAMLFRARKPSS